MKAITIPARAGAAALGALLLLAATAPDVQAEGAACVTSSDSSAASEALPDCASAYPVDDFEAPGSRWRFGLGAGFGERSNPLINSDDVPVNVVVQLSWYGDHFFFDNGDVGWFMAQGDRWSANLIAGIGGERSFYSYLNDSSISFIPGAVEGDDLVSSPGLGGDTPPGELSQEFEGEPEAPDRDLTVDGGLELSYQLGPSDIQLQLLTDISDKHNGQEVWLSWSLPQRFGKLAVQPSIGATWLSADTADYFYGVKESEAMPGLPAYDVGSALNYFIRLSVSYQLDEHWKLVTMLQHEELDSAIKDSSSVDKGQVQTSFFGLYYEF